MTWIVPIDRVLVPTTDRDLEVLFNETQLPLAPHPGGFGVRRKHHFHEGVDLYCGIGTTVTAVEPGVVVAVIPFTGPAAEPPSPWWHATDAVLVEGPSGVVVYGEIKPRVKVGMHVEYGIVIGTVLRVLLHEKISPNKPIKTYPTAMLHLELHEPGTRLAFDWIDEKPPSLRDPTPFLLAAKPWDAL